MLFLKNKITVNIVKLLSFNAANPESETHIA